MRVVMPDPSGTKIKNAQQDAETLHGSRRTEKRLSTFIPAQIISLSDEEPSGCAVINLSQSGAKLKLESDQYLPNQFKLITMSPKKELACQLVWAKDSKIGLEFIA